MYLTSTQPNIMAPGTGLVQRYNWTPQMESQLRGAFGKGMGCNCKGGLGSVISIPFSLSSAASVAGVSGCSIRGLTLPGGAGRSSASWDWAPTCSCPPFPPRSGGRGGSRARRVGPTRARDGAILAGGGEGQGGNGE